MKRAVQHQRFQLEALEPRILLSADGLAGAAASASTGATASLEIVIGEPEKTRGRETAFDLFDDGIQGSAYSASTQVDDIFGSGNTAENSVQESPLAVSTEGDSPAQANAPEVLPGQETGVVISTAEAGAAGK